MKPEIFFFLCQIRACVFVCSSLTRVQSMCRNVNAFFLCYLCRRQSVMVHIHEAAFLEHVNYSHEMKRFNFKRSRQEDRVKRYCKFSLLILFLFSFFPKSYFTHVLYCSSLMFCNCNRHQSCSSIGCSGSQPRLHVIPVPKNLHVNRSRSQALHLETCYKTSRGENQTNCCSQFKKIKQLLQIYTAFQQHSSSN